MPRKLLANFKDPAALACFFGVALLLMAVDLATKYWAFDALMISPNVNDQGRLIPESRTIEFLPGWLHFTITANYGAVFGLGEGKRPLFLVVSIAAVGFLTWLFATSGKQRGYQLLLAMLMAGVLGNLYDRMFFGYVRDMINILPRWPDLFPYIFNLADSYLCVGVTLYIVLSLFLGEKQPADAEAEPAGPKPPRQLAEDSDA